MSDWPELFLRVLLILNPLAAVAIWTSLSAPLEREARPRLGVAAGALALAGLLLAGLAADWVLDQLRVSAPTWEMGAGLLLLLGAVPAFMRRDPFTREPYGSATTQRWWATVRMALNIATPATLAALVYFGAAYDRGAVSLALLAAGGLTMLGLLLANAIEGRVGRLPLREGGRVLAALVVLLAVGMAVDGINSV